MPITRATLHNSANRERCGKKPLKYKVNVYPSTNEQLKQRYSMCGLHITLQHLPFRLEKFRCSSPIHFDFLTFFSVQAHLWSAMRHTHKQREHKMCVCVIAFFTVQTLSSCLAICWSQLFYYRGSERWASVELVSGLKMSTICFSYNSFQLLFLLPFVSLSRTLSVSQLPFHRHKSHRTWNANK